MKSIGGISGIQTPSPELAEKERAYKEVAKKQRTSIWHSLQVGLSNRNFFMLLGFVLTGLIGIGLVHSIGMYLRIYHPSRKTPMKT